MTTHVEQQSLFQSACLLVSLFLSVPALADPYDECEDYQLQKGAFEVQAFPTGEQHAGLTAAWICTDRDCDVGFSKSGKRFISFSLPISDGLRLCTLHQKLTMQPDPSLPPECSGTYHNYQIFIESIKGSGFASVGVSWINNASALMRICSDELAPEVDGIGLTRFSWAAT